MSGHETSPDWGFGWSHHKLRLDLRHNHVE
jgi:hypothetical protein